jgi:hypothetical protein
MLCAETTVLVKTEANFRRIDAIYRVDKSRKRAILKLLYGELCQMCHSNEETASASMGIYTQS